MLRHLLTIVLCVALSFGGSAAAGQRILVQSTTSTQNSGLYDYLLPYFEAETGWDVDVVAVGTGQAIRNAMNGDADVLLVHAKAAELEFVAESYGLARYDLMYNDFVLIGPAADPAGLADVTDLEDALSRLTDRQAAFISRGDDSGTHKKERTLWGQIDQAPSATEPWYHEAGAGMGATIRLAVELNAYTLTDRATWIAFGAKMDHRIVFEGDAALFNQYGIIAVNPAKFPHANDVGAMVFVNWMLSEHGQALIAEFRVGGQQLFIPNAGR